MMRASQKPSEDEAALFDPPGWAHSLAALTGVALLTGPMLAVLWPR